MGDIKVYKKNNFINWRHNRIRNLAKYLVGGDINLEGIDLVKKCGFNYIFFDVEKTSLSSELGKFDVILMLDVVEHLNNIGLALENLKNYMHTDSELIITTPNPFAFNNIIRVLIGKKPKTNEDHTAWFDETNLHQLAKRFKFHIKEQHYFTWNTNPVVKQKIINLAGNFNKYFHQSLVIVFTLEK
jgi:2-polyprenyl-3-methyl-5-hydroxy-6-metoxy-1,4-benzoquinol methylase